jgi:hypothetical protein
MASGPSGYCGAFGTGNSHTGLAELGRQFITSVRFSDMAIGRDESWPAAG